ncbi:glycosyltransferase [Chitinimonas koreensis]|uniref:glycosyltransferase n=2 Tax=Chitinimonas koreensis TaxID=356302 RepID=UPI00146FC01C|nr:glycosyltransferase [Chitinimonas koreensis]
MDRLFVVNDVANVFENLKDELSRRYELIMILRRPGEGRFMFYLRAWLRLALSRSPRDTVYVNYALHAFIARLAFRSGYIVHCHGTDIRENMANIYRGLTLWGMAPARFILYSTPDLAPILAREGIGNAYFLPNPIRFRDAAPAAASHDGVKVLFASKLDRTKGVDILLPAIRRVAELDGVAQVSYLAFGNAVPEQLPAAANIRPLQRMAYESMLGEMADHDVVVGQVALGAIGMTELEAMMMAKPVIAKWEHDQAYPAPAPILPAADAERIVGQVGRLCADPALREATGQASRNWVFDHHGSEAVANLLTRYIEQHR